MNTMFDLGSLHTAQMLLYRRNLAHYANSVLSGDISFNRAVKVLEFDTGDNIIYLEEDLADAIAKLCPLTEEATNNVNKN